ncbi:hypothetical protein [Flavobacterium sp.]|uniref:hypothetical protein n=1 Tax=Flavobacterium sp. TaxID=239 RepID=UPI003527200F
MLQRTLLFALLICFSLQAQEKSASQKFWEALQKHCGKSFEGELIEAPANDEFRGKKLVMHVKRCEKNKIRIPFFVGDDKSRTWVLTYKNGRITLKHDHRQKNGKPDKVTQYGGTSTNGGSHSIQFFPADEFTSELIPYASMNVWWITVDDKAFTYNLRRIGTDRVFSVSFDLSETVENPESPWGWKD